MKTVFRAALASWTVFGLVLASSCSAFAESNLRITTFAGTGERGYSGDGGPAIKAQLNNPFGIARGPDGSLYHCDMGNHVVRKVSADGIITTVAGTGKAGYSGDGGPATKAELNEPYEVRFDKAGNLFFVEMRNAIVRRVDAKTKIISTVAGSGKAGFAGDGGQAIEAQINQPHSIQFDARGDLYVCDILNHRIRKLDMKVGTLHHIAGTGKKGFTGNGGPARESTLSGPKGLSVAPDGNVYLADTESHSIRMIDPAKGTIALVAGTGEKGDGPEGDARQCKMLGHTAYSWTWTDQFLSVTVKRIGFE